ncbi:MAG: 6-carboxytetrahydropterin synthase [bacterium]
MTRLLELTRLVRLPMSVMDAGAGSNGLVGAPAAGLGAIGEFAVTCRGHPGPSGYLVDITVIDRAVRSTLPHRIAANLRQEAASGVPTDLTLFIHDAAEALAASLPVELASLAFRPNPFREIRVERCPSAATGTSHFPDQATHRAFDNATSKPMPNQAQSCQPTSTVMLCESFEFAASHRLHLADRSDEENRRLFGKCNNPNGHGHNYRIRVEVTPPTDAAGVGFGFPEIESIVEAEVMTRFDHRHLNLDCPEFAETNPSVENIARICHDLLAAAFTARGARLQRVEVWETDKTSCRYPS